MAVSDYPNLRYLPVRILFKVLRWMPIDRAKAAPSPRFKSAARIILIISSLIRVLLLASPVRGAGGLPRPFRLMSARFSALVPSQRWFGLTQDGLSQVWQTSRPSGILRLFSSSQENLVASTSFLSRRNMPYPVGSFEAVHPQHSSGPRRATLFQNEQSQEQSRSLGLRLIKSAPHSMQLSGLCFQYDIAVRLHRKNCYANI